MTAAGLWVPRAQRARRSQPPRPRRACLGELVQIDGSMHAWFEDRGPVCALLVYVDDATSRLMDLAFAAVESTTFDYFRATRRYFERHGKPMAFSSDRLSVFHVYARERAATGRGLSQFGRALREFNIVCTSDHCDGAGTCVNTAADGASCNDGNLCTTGETCMGGQCAGGTPVFADLVCGECDPATGATIQGPPRTGCKHTTLPGRSTLNLRDASDDRRDKLSWS
jgi:hypothetical protein